MELTFEGRSPRERYHLLTQLVIPRPIAWVLTDNGSELTEAIRWNLAPFSFFNGVASDPPTIAFSIGDGLAGRVKDTHRNVIERPVCVVHVPSRADAANVQATAAELVDGTSEVSITGRTVTSWDFPVPRLVGVAVALACHVRQVVDLFEDGRQHLVFGEVERVHVNDDAVVEERGVDGRARIRIDATVIDPLARLGSGQYAAIAPPFMP